VSNQIRRPASWLIGLKGIENESARIGEANLPQLQDHQAQWRGARDLQESTSQAAPRLKKPNLI